MTKPARPYDPQPPVAVRAGGGVAATGNALVTSIALDVLRRGGEAVDAAVAAAAVQSVVELPWGGLGGDLFALIRRPDGQVAVLNGSGTAPSALDPSRVPGGRVPRFGPLSVAVPGFVDALCKVHERFGTWPLDRLIEPAVEYAREGFPLTGDLSSALRRVRDQLDMGSEMWKLMDENGSEPGETFRCPELARTLAMVGEEGRDAFYFGRVAEQLANAVQSGGGFLRSDDFGRHSSEWVDPITACYGDAMVHTHPPVSFGCIMLQELRMYERLGLAGLDPRDPVRIDAMVRCKHAAFADTLELITADDATARIAGLLSDEHVDRRCQGLLSTPLTKLRRPEQPPSGSDTTCLGVADDKGGIVVLIHSLFNEFGSREYEASTGVLLNDRLGNQKAGRGAGEITGGRKPLHTLNAFFVSRDGSPVFAGATPGGRGQVQTNFQVLVNALDCGMDVQHAIDAPRWLSGAPRRPEPDDHLYLELDVGDDAIEGLRQRGHDVTFTDSVDSELFGSVVAVGHDPSGTLLAAADHRREATAAGY